jgi:hypothetical protein
MPAKSEDQQQFFAIALHNPSKLRGKMPKMSKEKMRHFAETPTKNLPKKKRKKKPGGLNRMKTMRG